MSRIQGKVEELRAQVKALQPAPIEGYNTIQNDERRTVEILHRNELERMDGERRLQYDKLIHDFLVCKFNFIRAQIFSRGGIEYLIVCWLLHILSQSSESVREFERMF